MMNHNNKPTITMNTSKLQIRSTTATDLKIILDINRQAFPAEDVAELVAGLLVDESAEPKLSLLALAGNEPVGYILFTRATIEGLSDQPLIYILAPLAVKPGFQKQGIGGKLIAEGISLLKGQGVDMVFVLGHETYYPKFGFIPDAKRFGFPATYPIPEEFKDAWMIYPLKKDAFNTKKGRIICADYMNSEEHWRE
jgi:putative acetyltransferase